MNKSMLIWGISGLAVVSIGVGSYVVSRQSTTNQIVTGPNTQIQSAQTTNNKNAAKVQNRNQYQGGQVNTTTRAS